MHSCLLVASIYTPMHAEFPQATDHPPYIASVITSLQYGTVLVLGLR